MKCIFFLQQQIDIVVVENMYFVSIFRCFFPNKICIGVQMYNFIFITIFNTKAIFNIQDRHKNNNK